MAESVSIGSKALPTQLTLENRMALEMGNDIPGSPGGQTIRRRKLLPQDAVEIGMAGTKVFAGMVFEDPNVELQGFRRIPKLQQMSYDATVAAMLAVHDRPIRAAPWRVEPASDSPAAIEQADFVWWVLNEFGSQSFDDVIRECHTRHWAGFNASEIVYDIVSEGKYKNFIGWDKLAWRHPMAKWRWDIEEIDTAGGAKLRQLVAMTQLAPPEYRFIPIPREKLLLWVQDLTGENFDGDPLIRKSYAAWFFKTYLMKIQAIGLQRGYMGVPIATYPENFTENEVAAAQSIVETMRVSENAGVVKPAHLGLEMVHLALEGTPMQQAIEFHDRQILVSTLSQFLDLGGANGSFALSQDQSELFLMALDAQANYDAQIINLEPGIPRLIQYNYGPQELYPKLVHGQIGQRDFERLARGLAYMAMAGLLTADDGLEDALRDQLNLPERDASITDELTKNLITQVVGDYYRLKASTNQESARYGAGKPLNQAAMKQQMQQQLQMQGGGFTGAPPQPPQLGANNNFGANGGGSGLKMSEEEIFGLPLPFLGSQASLEFSEAMARKRWPRPKGRLSDEHRRRVRNTEKFAEALAAYRPHIGEKMVKPSIYAAMHRTPYVLRTDIKLAEPSTPTRRSVVTPVEQIAGRHAPGLQTLLADRFGARE